MSDTDAKWDKDARDAGARRATVVRDTSRSYGQDTYTAEECAEFGANFANALERLRAKRHAREAMRPDSNSTTV